MRKDISFPSSGLTLRGWFYEPPAGSGKAPAILMSHGFSAVKEQGLAGFAEAFNTAGFAVLAFDHRHLGASDGAERGRIIPHEQHDDQRAALAWLTAQSGVDPDRIGLWGSSYSGGHAFFMGAVDPRVKAVVAQAPAVDGPRMRIATGGKAAFDEALPMFAADHAARNTGAPSSRIPVVAPAGQPCVLATPDSFDWFTGTRDAAPNWVETTTIESLARAMEYQPASLIDLIAPKPLLIIAATSDALIPIAQVRDAFARAGEPKKLVEIDCGHFDFYPGMPHHARAVAEATAWFRSALA
jgi:fermentation-respiration switch protein FrsA (DUF1100 family)